MKKKVVKEVVEKEEKAPLKVNEGKVMNDSGIMGDGALVKKAE